MKDYIFYSDKLPLKMFKHFFHKLSKSQNSSSDSISLLADENEDNQSIIINHTYDFDNTGR